jgi:threonine aldolase
MPRIALESSFDEGLPKMSEESMRLDTFEAPKIPDFPCSELIHQPEPRILSPLPNIWTYQYQMGPTPYVDALGANEAIAEQLKIDWTPSNSPFSEHVSALKNILREKWDGMGRSPESYPDL